MALLVTATHRWHLGDVFVSTRRQLHVSQALNAGKLWRQSVGLSKLQTARGPLIDLPDYSFVDGRPVPIAIGQLRRQDVQQNLAAGIVSGLSYLEKATNRLYAQKTELPQLLPIKEKSPPRKLLLKMKH